MNDNFWGDLWLGVASMFLLFMLLVLPAVGTIAVLLWALFDTAFGGISQ